MIEKPKKKQHYVWRKYLKKWSSSKNSIPTYFKEKGYVQTTDLMNVAQSRYFHKMFILSEHEILLAKSYIHSFNNADAVNFAERLLNLYVSYKDYSIQQSNYTYDIPIPNLNRILKDLEVNTFENFVSKLETLGNKILECKSLEELKMLDGIDIYNSLFYVSLQYFRTNKMRQNLIKGFGENSEIGIVANKIWNIIFIHLALVMTSNALKRNDYTFIFVKNSSNVSFITSDQPVCNDLENEGEDIKDFEFYYPISPIYAIIIQFGQCSERYKETVVDEAWVNVHNHIIWNNAFQQVFADSEKLLISIKNMS